MIKYILFLYSLFVTLITQSQIYDQNYNWEENPTIIELNQDYAKEDAVVLEEVYIFDYKLASFIFWKEIKHVKIKILTDQGVSENITQYIPDNSNDYSDFTVKSRVISPSGKITNITPDSIYSGKINAQKMKYFAIEGLQKGSVIEIFSEHIAKRRDNIPTFSNINSDCFIQKKTMSFIVSNDCDKTFKFNKDSLTYSKDSLSFPDQDQYLYQLSNVPKIVKEKFDRFSDIQSRIYFKFKRATEPIPYQFISDLAAHPKIFIGGGPKIIFKVLEEIESISPFSTDSSQLKQLRTYEYWIKTIIQKNENTPFDGERLTANDFAFILYYADKINLERQLLFLCPNDYHVFPIGMYDVHYHQEPIIYFPKYDVCYTSRGNHRIGPIPLEYINSKGIISHSEMGYIEMTEPDMEYSIDSMSIQLSPNVAQETVEISAFRQTTGYAAEPYQANLSFVSSEEKQNIKLGYLKYMIGESIIQLSYFENDLSSCYNYKPFIGKVDATSSDHFIENGDFFLLDIGSFIGPQTDLYDQVGIERTNNIFLDFPHKYIREFKIICPKGYQFTNLDALNISITSNDKLGFVSKYTVEGNELRITINEWYSTSKFSAGEYQDFVKVYNAAADFNNVKLVLEKL